MNTVHITAFDLNLLNAFDALWSERNVTRAARRVGLSQSALSHALKRLRAQLDDELFIAAPSGMVPTARAQAMAVPVAEALERLREALSRPAPFSPRALRRSFTVGATDYGELVILPRLVARLEKEAPEVTLVVRPVARHSDEDLLSGAHDLVISVSGSLGEGVRDEKLLDERFVCVVRRGHPLAKKRLTLARFLALPHALVAPQNVGEGVVDVALRALGHRRRITLRVAHFLTAPLAIAESNHVITLPERLVQALTGLGRFAVHAPPLAVPGFSISQFWHQRNDDDAGHRWFRALVSDVARKPVASSARARR